jgi:hypothetical protein
MAKTRETSSLGLAGPMVVGITLFFLSTDSGLHGFAAFWGAALCTAPLALARRSWRRSGSGLRLGCCLSGACAHQGRADCLKHYHFGTFHCPFRAHSGLALSRHFLVFETLPAWHADASGSRAQRAWTRVGQGASCFSTRRFSTVR